MFINYKNETQKNTTFMVCKMDSRFLPTKNAEVTKNEGMPEKDKCRQRGGKINHQPN